MTEWKEYKLGDIISLHRGYDLPSSKRKAGNVPIVSSSGISDFHNSYKVMPPGVITGRYGTIGEVFYVNEPYWPLNTTLYVDDFKGNDALFIYYFLKSIDFEKYNDKSTIPGINRNHLYCENVTIPSLDTQRRIAAILSSLDDKIDLLRRENATLEQMAETLFRQWFVVEAKEEWEEGKLGDYVELVNGVSYKGNELQPSNVAMATLKSFSRNGGFRMDGYKEYVGKYKNDQVLSNGDLIVAHTDITQEADVIGNPALVCIDSKYDAITFSMDVVKVVSKTQLFSSGFLYYLMKAPNFKEHCLGYANGSTVLHLSKKAIPEFEFLLPPLEKIQAYNNIVSQTLNKVGENNKQIQTLIQMRDGLLPRLMSGEVKL